MKNRKTSQARSFAEITSILVENRAPLSVGSEVVFEMLNSLVYMHFQ